MRFLVSEIRSVRTLSRTQDIEPQLLIKEAPHFILLRRPLHTTLEAKMTDSGIIVSGKISTVITMECARCLEALDRPYEVSFQQFFNSDLKEIDLSEDVRETVLIDLPFKALCKEDCKGLCRVCGKNRNKFSCSCPPEENSRWDALKQYPFK